MSRIPDAFLDDLLARTDIVELIGARVPLKRQGREYSARCPFHDERSPSFTVSPVKQFYHCFGCGAHGTALRFLMEYDRLEFLDAVDELAKRIGVEVPRDTLQSQARGEFTELYATCEAAAAFFRAQLAGSSKAQQYLGHREVDAEQRQRFAIGYAPDSWDALKNQLGGDPQRLALLEKVGLLSKNDSGRVYDKFRDRLIFPIHDRRGRVIAFGGRVLEKDDGPKYLNSPETPLFHKGRELYGLWQVRQAHAKIPRLVVVEGYMDVVALFQYGVTTAVATLGTATTPDHAELLFRNAADVYFCFDGDKAGRGAAWKALESVLPRMKDGRQAFFLFLPEGEDPDSMVRKHHAAGFDRFMQSALPLSEFMFQQLAMDVDTGTTDGRARLAERSKQLIERVPDGEFKDGLQELQLRRTSRQSVAAMGAEWARDLVEKHDRDSSLIARGQLPEGYAVRGPQRVSHRPQAAAPKRSLVRTSIALLLQQPRLATALPPPYPFATLRLPGIALLIELLELCTQRPDLTTGALLELFAERDEGAALQKLALQEFPGDETVWRAELLDAVQQLGRQTLQQRLDDLGAKQVREGLDDEEKQQLRELLRARGAR
jgi:DNA primase